LSQRGYPPRRVERPPCASNENVAKKHAATHAVTLNPLFNAQPKRKFCCILFRRATFVVNSELHTGARPSVRLRLELLGDYGGYINYYAPVEARCEGCCDASVSWAPGLPGSERAGAHLSTEGAAYRGSRRHPSRRRRQAPRACCFAVPLFLAVLAGVINLRRRRPFC
jgi:hypothetical protein